MQGKGERTLRHFLDARWQTNKEYESVCQPADLGDCGCVHRLPKYIKPLVRARWLHMARRKYPIDKIRHRLEPRHIFGNNCQIRTCVVVEAEGEAVVAAVVIGKESCSNGAEETDKKRRSVSRRHSCLFNRF